MLPVIVTLSFLWLIPPVAWVIWLCCKAWPSNTKKMKQFLGVKNKPSIWDEMFDGGW